MTTTTISRHSLTLRGLIALILAVFAVMHFPFLRPAFATVSGRGTFVTAPVTSHVWIIGGILIVICLIATVEAFQRGTPADKICACLAALFTLALIFQYFELASILTQTIFQEHSCCMAQSDS